jgi:hypothetical protein
MYPIVLSTVPGVVGVGPSMVALSPERPASAKRQFRQSEVQDFHSRAFRYEDVVGL